MPLNKLKKWCAIGVLMGAHAVNVAAEPVVVVSARSSINSLTANQLTDIFLGRTSHFPNGDVVIPIDQPEGSDIREEFYSRYINRSSAQVKAYWSKIIFTGKGQPPEIMGNNERLKRKLSENGNYISYIDRSALDQNMKVVTVTKP